MNAKQAAEKAINLGKQLQAVIEVGEVLNEIGDLELAKEKAIEEANEAAARWIASSDSLKAIKDDINIAQVDFERIKREAKELNINSKARRDRMIGVAREEASKMVKEATKGANDLIANAEDDINKLQNKRDGLLKEITDSQKGVTNLENQMKALRERLG